MSTVLKSIAILGREKNKQVGMDSMRKTLSDAALEEEWEEVQAAQRNPARFRPLYQRYYEPIFRYVFRRTSDEHLTADICSQIFLKALQRIGSYEYKGVPFSAWLYRIAGNEVAQHYRNSKKNRVVSLEYHSVSRMVEEMRQEVGIEKPQTPSVHKMIEALQGMKESDIQLIELRFFEERPFKEIAAILDITESNAKVRTYRVLERLKKRIEQ